MKNDIECPQWQRDWRRPFIRSSRDKNPNIQMLANEFKGNIYLKFENNRVTNG